MKLWVCALALAAAAPLQAQQGADSAEVRPLLQAFQRLQPGSPVRVIQLDGGGFGALLARRLERSAAIGAERARVGALADEISAAELSFRPVVSWSAGHDRYATYDRPGLVRARIPVAWDEKDPVQADINLPNGGRGLIWLPRATEYDERDIIVHASRAYANELSTATVGLNKAYASGLQLSLMNLSMNRRWAPTSYRHPWSMSLGNRLDLPLLRGAGGAGMVATLELLNQREEARIASVSLRNAELQERAELLRAYADLRTGWELYRSGARRAALLDEQLVDVALLRERQVITSYELVRIRDAARDARRQGDALAESFLVATLSLNEREGAGDTLALYVPSAWDPDGTAAALAREAGALLTSSTLPGWIDGLAPARAASSRLEQARNELAYARSQQRPELSLRGSLDLFQSNDMGYRTSGQAFQRAFTEPDGIVWNVGVVGSLPLGRVDHARGNAALKRVRAAEADLAEVRRDLRESARRLAVQVRAAGERVGTARGHAQSADSLLSSYARPLYDARRLTRSEFAGFAADAVGSRMDWIAAWREYVDAVLDLALFAGADLEPFGHALR